MTTVLTVMQIAAVLHMSVAETQRTLRANKVRPCAKRANRVKLFNVTDVMAFIRSMQS